MFKKLIFTYVFISVAFFCQADVINVPSDYATIQEGIHASVNGDTVLVQPGTYVENVNFNGKNITLGSLYLTTQDTSYISQTIIDGDSLDSVVRFQNGEDSTAVLTGFTVTNGYNGSHGGGIYIGGSDPVINNVYITDNSAWESGGGVYCRESKAHLQSVKITNNVVGQKNSFGGGIYIVGSELNIVNSEIKNNESGWMGGGLGLRDNSNAYLDNVLISDNWSRCGGGISQFNNSISHLKNVQVTYNTAIESGGGLFCIDSSYVVFDETERSNIFLNNCNTKRTGADISSSSYLDVFVDTFTVLNPTEYHAAPINNFNLNILKGKLQQSDNDLYVAPWGNNDNDGFTPQYPLKTIQYAASVILSDSLNPRVIHLAEGIYSNTSNGEFFPISLPDFVTISGGSAGVILDAEEKASVLRLHNVNVELYNLIIQNGYGQYGSGIYSNKSTITMKNVIIRNNETLGHGGGIYACYSDLSLMNVIVADNISSHFNGGGIYIRGNTIMNISNSTINGNIAEGDAGGIYIGSGGSCFIDNSIISDNNNYGIYADRSHDGVDISYSNFWNNEFGNFYGLNDSIGVNVMTNVNGDSCDAFYNIQMDPLFVDPTNGDYHLSWTNYPVHDYTMSPCIDAGDPNSPLDPDSTIADMGAYYFHQTLGTGPELEIHELSLKNYPNPFQSSTTISFSVPKATKVGLQIYNVKGQLVEEILKGDLQSGEGIVEWDSGDYPSGVYFYKLSTPQTSLINKMVIMK